MNEESCIQSGECNDKDVLDMSIHGGVCIGSYHVDMKGNIECDHNSPYGCINEDLTTKEACEDEDHHEWIVPSLERDACLSKWGCFNEKKNYFTLKNESQCSSCDDHVWRPYFEWTSASWLEREIVPLTWQLKEYSPIRKVEPSLDVFSFTSEIHDLIGGLFSYSFSTHGRCRYGSILPLVETILCDCSVEESNDPKVCFQSTQEQHVASTQGCPYLSMSMLSRNLEIYTYPTSFPPEGFCRNITVYATSASTYKLDPSRSISSAIFQNTETNAFWVVKNSRKTFIGQIVSDAFRVVIDSTLNDDIQLCFNISSSIEKSELATDRKSVV